MYSNGQMKFYQGPQNLEMNSWGKKKIKDKDVWRKKAEYIH